MKRLTGRRDGHTYIVGCPDFALPKIAGLIIQQAVDRLAAIEDILGDEYDLDRLRELAQADREGRCVVLPIKRGTPVWSTAFCQVDDDGTEHPTYPWPFDLSMADEWGKEWFLTREEAYAALRREQE